MTETIHYLFHHTPPLGVGRNPVLCLLSPGLPPREVSLKELASTEGVTITHSFSLLVDWMRDSQLNLRSAVFDLEVASKLLTGLRKATVGRERPWSLWGLLKESLESARKTEALGDLVRYGLREYRGTHCELVTRLGELVELLPAIWERLRSGLESAGESSRFLDVEVPVYNIMLGVQREGVTIDPARSDLLLREIEERYETIHYDLAINEQINVDRAFYDHKYLAEILSLPEEALESYRSARLFIQENRHFSRMCASLHELESLKRNRDILCRTIAFAGDSCFVTFDTMGTVTGRILAADPHLQQLKKAYRSALVARPGMQFVYIDYAQYEPTIMAALSGDGVLRDLCKGGDLYSALALRIGPDVLEREEAKRLFLSYAYGLRGLELEARLGPVLGESTDVERVVSTLSEALAGVERWKTKIWEEVLEKGRMGSALGNYRYRTREGPLEPSEERWSVSQVVQGTGALILKKVCIAVHQKCREARIVLPMHDALLLEVPPEGCQEIKKQLLDLFRTSFREFCQEVEPRIVIRSFYADLYTSG